jgi:hypothetical protein
MHNTSIRGSVATLQACRDRLVGCSFWTLRFAVYSNGVNSSRRSSSWQWDGSCASRFRTATSRSYWPSADSRWITSPSGAGSSGTPRSWIDACANGSRQQRLLAGGRDVRPGQRQMGVLVPGRGLERCDDRLPSRGQARCSRGRALSDQSLGRGEPFRAAGHQYRQARRLSARHC